MSLNQRAIDTLGFTRQCTLDLLKGFPDDRLTYQPTPQSNHALWILGHIASTEDWIAAMLDGKASSYPEAWQKLFGYQSTPKDDPSLYPSLDEVRRQLDSTRQRMLAAIGALSDDQLIQPLGERGRGFVKDPFDGALKMVWHEGWHGGQLATIRRSLNLPAAL